MMKTESDLMKGIDDKFQKLLSQFEMNMNILEMKSKRQQFLVEQSKEDGPIPQPDKMKKPEPSQNRDKSEKRKIPTSSGDYNSAESGKDSEISSKGRMESVSEKSESLVTVKEIDTNVRPKHKTYSMKLKMDDNVKAEDEEHPAQDVSMENVLKYISECADMQNKKNKRRKRTISFGQKEPPMPEPEEESSINLVGSKLKPKKKKNNAISNDNQSGTSSKKKSNRSNHEVVRKCSKTVTNISKKGKKRTLKNANHNSKDWISFNRNNAGKLQKATKSKTQLIKKEDIKRKTVTEKPKNAVKKETVEIDQKQENKIEHFDTIENKLIKDFFKNELYQPIDVKNKNKINDLVRKPLEKVQLRRNNDERISFRTPKTQLKVLTEDGKLNEVNINIMDLPKRINVDNSKRNILGNTNKLKNDRKVLDTGKKLLARTVQYNNKENNNIINQRLDTKMSNRSEDRKTVVSNIELSKTLNERFKDHREIRSERDVPRAKSEIKVGSAPSKMFSKGEDNGDLEDVKVELDEFFSEIPFVVGRSISRTFNLGLSFQHAMSMLKRVHSKKEVKEVLSIGRPESVPYSESLHCLGAGNTCEAMFSSDWTKEDEEAWAENPWDPELNRRRPKCTCLPNNCTTLKNVLKQLTIKNPGFNMRSLQPSLSNTTNKLEMEATELLKKPALKRAKSQTRTELLRNIRTIQIQLTPSTEILK